MGIGGGFVEEGDFVEFGDAGLGGKYVRLNWMLRAVTPRAAIYLRWGSRLAKRERSLVILNIVKEDMNFKTISDLSPF